MKILYLSHARGADYQCDMLFHGLRSLLGPDAVDVNKLTFMYTGEPHPPFFTVYANLPEIEVDRSDIENKIRSRYFDAIIYGSIQRDKSHLDLVRSAYPPTKIAFIDGEDDQVILNDLRGQGLYFKREIPDGLDWLLPIEFCIPKEKIWIPNIHRKSSLMAPCDPRDRSTYIYYGSETEYYRQYSQSYFGVTMKKGGWDSCRHYEIMAAGAVPYFLDLEQCPEKTLFWMPKKTLLRARDLQSRGDAVSMSWLVDWAELYQETQVALSRHLTTEAMAKYVLEKIQ